MQHRPQESSPFGPICLILIQTLYIPFALQDRNPVWFNRVADGNPILRAQPHARRNRRNQRLLFARLAELGHQQEDSCKMPLAGVEELIEEVSLDAHTAG